MGYSGLIYAAIVAAWAAFLVPRWVRRNEEVERAREADTVRGVRVLQRGGTAMHAPHRGLAADESETQRVDAEPAAPSAPDELGDAFADAARRRRRILTVLLAATVAVVGAAGVGRVPGWLAVFPGALTVVFLVAARRAAVTQAQRRRAEARRRRTRAVQQADRPDVRADDTGWTISVDDTTRRLVIPDEAEQVADAEAWQPVPVPLPTYVTKPMAPRVTRKIDLSKPGSWTSGRLDPVGSVDLPRRDPDERPSAATESPADATSTEADVQPEHRRAVGD